MVQHFTKFLVVENPSASHEVLRRPALKELETSLSIHHLYMKFPMENDIATVKGIEEVLKSLKKVEPKDLMSF